MTAAALPHRYNPRRLKSKAAAISNVVADLNGLGSKESRTCPSHVRSRPATRLPPAGPFARQWLFTCSRETPSAGWVAVVQNYCSGDGSIRTDPRHLSRKLIRIRNYFERPIFVDELGGG